MRSLRRFFERFKAWTVRRRTSQPALSPVLFSFSSHQPLIHREVTPYGVRVYSLCGSCGATLHASATLCDECAQKRSKPARPY